MRNEVLKTFVVAACAGLAATAWGEEAAPQESTTVSGKMFVDISYIDNESDGNSVDPTGWGNDVKRFYVGIDHKFDDMWSANVTTDFNFIANDSETQVFVKKAYVQAKVADALVVRAGSADLPWVPFVEGLYGFRYVENVVTDRDKFGTSADWGLHALGKFMGGKIAYAASVVNGGGYKNSSRTNSVDFEGRVSIEPISGLTFALGGYSGKLGQDTEANPAERTATRKDVLVAYVHGPIRAGAEYFEANNWKTVQNAVAVPPPGTTSDDTDGYSLWGSYQITQMFGAFARYDRVNPSNHLNSDLEDKYWNLGFTCHARKNVDFALVYKNDKVDSGNLSTSNGTIGGPNATTDGEFKEIGLWAQIQF